MYNFKFDKRNPNGILIYKDFKLINMIAIPPTSSACDIINFSKPILIMTHFEGLIIFSTPTERKMYHESILIDTIER